MRTDADFQIKYSKLKSKFRRSIGKLFIPVGNDWYMVTNVTDHFVEITQGLTPQPHLTEHLKALFTVGYFFGQRPWRRRC